MVRVVRFGHEIGDRELQLVRPEPSAAAFGRETVTLAKEEQDIGRLSDEQLAGLQERWRERRLRDAIVVEHGQHDVLSAVCSRNIVVTNAGFFERQPHEFAATLDRRPVVQRVSHGGLALESPLQRMPA